MKRMIVINGRFLTQKITGVQRVGIELVKALDNLVRPGEIEIIAPPGIINNINLKNIPIKIVGARSSNLWVQISYAIYVKKTKGLSLTLAGLPPVVCPGFFVAHDITFYRHPESFDWRFRIVYGIVFKLSLKRCKHIFTVSEFSKRELSSVFSVNPSRISVIYNSSEHLLNRKTATISLEKWGIDNKPFFLSVGSINAHKNQQFIISLASKYPKRLFVIVGQKEYLSFSRIDNRVISNVIMTGYVSQDELIELYKNTEGFIFPSKYEGFGIPPLEAITLGVKRVALADIPVFREIYDRGVYYFSPYSIDDFSFESFERCVVDNDDLEYYRKKYSWVSSAIIVLNTINNSQA